MEHTGFETETIGLGLSIRSGTREKFPVLACLVGLQENISLLAKSVQFPIDTQAARRVKASASFNVLLKETPLKNIYPEYVNSCSSL